MLEKLLPAPDAPEPPRPLDLETGRLALSYLLEYLGRDGFEAWVRERMGDDVEAVEDALAMALELAEQNRGDESDEEPAEEDSPSRYAAVEPPRSRKPEPVTMRRASEREARERGNRRSRRGIF